MQGFFIVAENKEEPFDIKCELHRKYAKKLIPREQEELYIEVEQASNVIKSLHNTSEAMKRKYFKKLLSLAQAGLVGKTAQPSLAMKSLEKLKAEIVLIEGTRIKNDYMTVLGIKSTFLCMIVILGYVLSLQIPDVSSYRMYLLALIGTFAGTWVSFGARKFYVNFEQLSLLEEDMMSPTIRLLYVGVCSIMFMLFLNTGTIIINLGEVTPMGIKNNAETQLLIGVLCGLVESKLGVNMYNKATTILSKS